MEKIKRSEYFPKASIEIIATSQFIGYLILCFFVDVFLIQDCLYCRLVVSSGVIAETIQLKPMVPLVFISGSVCFPG